MLGRFSIPSPAGKWGNEEEETTHTPPPIPGTLWLCRLWLPQAGCEGGSDGLVGMGECCVTCWSITYAPLPRRRPQAWLHTEWTWTRIAWGCPQITPLHIGDYASGNLARCHLGWARARQGWLHCSARWQLLWWQSSMRRDHPNIELLDRPGPHLLLAGKASPHFDRLFFGQMIKRGAGEGKCLMTKHWQIDLERGMTEIVIKNNDCCNHRWPQSKAAAKRDANDSNC